MTMRLEAASAKTRPSATVAPMGGFSATPSVTHRVRGAVSDARASGAVVTGAYRRRRISLRRDDPFTSVFFCIPPSLHTTPTTPVSPMEGKVLDRVRVGTGGHTHPVVGGDLVVGPLAVETYQSGVLLAIEHYLFVIV